MYSPAPLHSHALCVSENPIDDREQNSRQNSRHFPSSSGVIHEWPLPPGSVATPINRAISPSYVSSCRCRRLSQPHYRWVAQQKHQQQLLSSILLASTLILVLLHQGRKKKEGKSDVSVLRRPSTTVIPFVNKKGGRHPSKKGGNNSPQTPLTIPNGRPELFNLEAQMYLIVL